MVQAPGEYESAIRQAVECVAGSPGEPVALLVEREVRHIEETDDADEQD